MILYMDASIAPSRSLSPKGARILLGMTVLANLVICTLMLLLHAWPVPFFLGLDVLLVWWALRASQKSALNSERVQVSAEAITVSQERPGRASKPVWSSPTAFTRVLVEAQGEPEVRVSLALRARRRVLAAAMSAPEREAFALALQDAIWAARRERHPGEQVL
ncbi:MAG: Protein of unknown function transrane [Caulobacteraceae bacterium]|nr:Protein of unknown function transrane [Caulobacteraceae bacterium]